MKFTRLDQTKTLAYVRAQLAEQPWGKPDRNEWEAAWAEQPETTPGYLTAKVGQIKRYEGQFVLPEDPEQEIHWLADVRAEAMGWMASYDWIYEFGCGSGQNLAEFRKVWPEKKLVGLDWSGAAVTHAGKIAIGRHFNFYRPDWRLDLPPSTAVFTMHALEQTGDRYGEFLEWCRVKKPEVCVHIEPIVDWLDDTPFDGLMREYMTRRDLLSGLPAAVRNFGTVLHEKRNRFGSMFIEAYSVLVWRPE